jgi:cytoskeletal protein CcmA (bactofilin family)
MKQYRFMLYFLFIFLLFAALPLQAVVAQEVEGRVIPSGQIVDEDITLVEGDLTIESGAVVNGDVTLFNGDLTLDGTVNGNVTLLDGTLIAGESATVDGDCTLFSGTIEETEERFLNCRSVSFPGLGRIVEEVTVAPPTPVMPESPHSWGFGRFLSNVAETAGWTFTLGVLALVIASVFPRQLHQVSVVISEKPVASGTVGLLTWVAGASLIALMSVIFALLILACGIGLLGFPIVMVVAAALTAAAVMGWVAIGHKVGVWLADTFKLKNPTLPTTTVLGTVALSFLVGLFNIIGLEFGQWLLVTIVGAVGLGAAALTQFGTRPYPVPAVDPNKVAAAISNMPE